MAATKSYGFYVDSFAQVTWRGFYSWGDELYSYGAAYTFAAYTAMQYGGVRAVSFIKELAGNDGIDRDCVEGAIMAFGSADKFENTIAELGLDVL